MLSTQRRLACNVGLCFPAADKLQGGLEENSTWEVGALRIMACDEAEARAKEGRKQQTAVAVAPAAPTE